MVLIFSNLLISLFRKAIPNGVRMPAYIVIVASLVTIVEFIMKAYTPALAKQLGVYILSLIHILLRTIDNVGITAGASTPNKIIEEVQNNVRNEF